MLSKRRKNNKSKKMMKLKTTRGYYCKIKETKAKLSEGEKLKVIIIFLLEYIIYDNDNDMILVPFQ